MKPQPRDARRPPSWELHGHALQNQVRTHLPFAVAHFVLICPAVTGGWAGSARVGPRFSWSFFDSWQRPR